MAKKLFISLMVILVSVLGVSGYTILQNGGTTPSLKTNSGNLIPTAISENDTYINSPKREMCDACAGTGWSRQSPCLNCNGTGVLKCTACNGTGECSNGTICPVCHGTGEIICPVCHGTGGTRCKYCGGDGYYDPEKGDKKA